jgi:hypothetical protein
MFNQLSTSKGRLTMQRQMQRHAMALALAARAHAGYGNGLGFGSPSIWSGVTVPTTDEKAKCPERPEAIPW